MKQVWNSLRLAFSMYSIIPARKVEKNKENMQYLLCFVPLVGIVIAWVLDKWSMGGTYLLNSSFLKAVVCALVPIILSKGAYLDGFFRTVDALCSHKSQDGKLEILKDSHSGYFAIITCISYFLLLVGLWSELPLDAWPVVVVGFVISRAIHGLTIILFPHSQESKGSSFVPEGKTKIIVSAVLMLYLAGSVIWMLNLNVMMGLSCLAGTLLAFLFYCYVTFVHFGGVTEDIASFFVQVCELVIPLVVIIVYRIPIGLVVY